MGQGKLTDNGGIFTDVIYDKTSMEGFNQLLAEGYLAPLNPLRMKTDIDLSQVGIQKGEFVSTQLEGAMDKADITYKALQETIEAGYNRKSWLIFASGINHAEHIAEQLGAFGIDCAPVHSKRPMEYNDAAIAAFKRGELRSIVNYGKLTTGFNHPAIDLIIGLRPTMSVPLHVQMLGRGTRPFQGKNDCLVLDFAKNVGRLGAINDPQIPNKKGNGNGELPIKICDACGCYNFIRLTHCTNCGAEFSFEVKITANAGTAELIRKEKEAPVIVTYPVDYAIYQKHEKVGMPPSIKATYFSGHDRFNEFVCLQHKGLAKHKANDWWRKRVAFEPPNTVDEAMRHVKVFRTPKLIRVQVNLRYPEIIATEF
jgi:DNA repair protein RadD